MVSSRKKSCNSEHLHQGAEAGAQPYWSDNNNARNGGGKNTSGGSDSIGGTASYCGFHRPCVPSVPFKPSPSLGTLSVGPFERPATTLEEAKAAHGADGLRIC